MSWMQCHLEWLEEARQKGRESFRRGELIKPSPRFEDYKYSRNSRFVNAIHAADAFNSANQYHTHWVMGWKRAQQEAT